MRIAILSDIHGNLTAFEAVIADIKTQAPDVVYHLGDIAASGPRPSEVVDLLQSLGWTGVYGNVDEMLWDQSILDSAIFAAPERAKLRELLVNQISHATNALIGQQRLEWLRTLPLAYNAPGGILLCHASPQSCWASPRREDGDEVFEKFFGGVGKRFAIFGHVHQPLVRKLEKSGVTVINTGSVSFSYDGDWRSSYLIMDDGVPIHRRVEYDRAKEETLIRESTLPHKEWLAQMLSAGKYIDPF